MLRALRHRRHNDLRGFIAICVAMLLLLRPAAVEAAIAAAADRGPVLCVSGMLVALDAPDDGFDATMALDVCPEASSSVDPLDRAPVFEASNAGLPVAFEPPPRALKKVAWRASRPRAPPA